MAEHIAKSNICLGIFGNTDKAMRVIPCKIYNCLAMKKPVITAKTPAISELLEDKKNVILSSSANSENLAEKILLLKNNNSLRNKIANNGYKAFMNNASPDTIGKSLNKII